MASRRRADDVAALLRHLDISQADLFGFSNGASIALQVAIRHPALVRKLVFASAMTKKGRRPLQAVGVHRQGGFLQHAAALNDAFLRVNPRPDQLRVMHDKDLAEMRTPRDVPDELR